MENEAAVTSLEEYLNWEWGGLHTQGSEKPSGLPLATYKFICALAGQMTFALVPAMPGFSDKRLNMN